MDDREITAHHESGHAVANHFFDFPIDYVAVTDSKGVCELEREKVYGRLAIRAAVGRDNGIQRIICLSAGAQAVQHFSGEPDTRATQDHEIALKLALELNGGDKTGAELLMKWCEHCARSIVEGEAKQIQKLAGKLLEREQLSGEQVNWLLSGHNGSSER